MFMMTKDYSSLLGCDTV